VDHPYTMLITSNRYQYLPEIVTRDFSFRFLSCNILCKKMEKNYLCLVDLSIINKKKNRLKMDILFTEDAIQCKKFERCISNTIMGLLYYDN